MEKKYDRLRLNTGQHRRVMLAALVLGLLVRAWSMGAV